MNLYLVVFGGILAAIGSVMTLVGVNWDKLHQSNNVGVVTENAKKNTLEATEAHSFQEKIDIKRKGVEIKIARYLEDAEAWLSKQKSSFLTQADRIKNDAAARNIARGGAHIKLHINSTNAFIETTDAYLKSLARQIQDLLLEINEDDFEKAKGFQSEYQRFVEFKKAIEVSVEWVKKQNYSTCALFTDKQTLDNIFKSNQYVR